MRRTTVLYSTITLIILVLAFGAGYYVAKPSTPTTPPMPRAVNGLTRPSVYTLVHGWYRGIDITYLDFGPSGSIAAPILAFFQSDAPNSSVAGQNNIIDTIPGLPSYSDFWRVYKVLVPAGYVPNSVRSFDEALASGYTIEATNLIVNCPVVNPNATTVGYNPALEQGWFRDRPVYYFNMGTNTHSVDAADGYVLQSAPIYAFFYANGTPVPGQHNVVDVRPGDPSYSDLWGVVKITVNASYVPNSINDTTAINAAIASEQVTQQLTGLYRNCPVVPTG